MMMLKMMNPFGSVTDALPSVGGGDSEDRCVSSDSFTNLEFRIYGFFSWIFIMQVIINLFVTSKNETTNSPIHEFKVLQNVFKSL